MKHLTISRYSESIELLDQDGCKKILVFGFRNCQLRLLTFDLWEKIQQQNYAYIDSAIVDDLKNINLLIPATQDELSVFLTEQFRQKNLTDSESIYLIIQVTANCQLNCFYCGQKHSKQQLSFTHQNHLINHVLTKLAAANNTSYKRLTICWFGGEPLLGMAIIKSLTSKFIAIAATYNLEYSSSIITNGLCLSKEIIKDLLYNCKVEAFDITLDGTAKFHNKRRMLKSKKQYDLFTKIYKNIIELTNIAEGCHHNIEIYLRCNVDPTNAISVIPLLRQIAKDNLQRKLLISMEQVHSWGNEADQFAMSLPEFAKHEIEWIIAMKHLGFSVQFLPNKAKIFCAAQSLSTKVIDPFGNIYCCSELSITPAYEVNNTNIYMLGHITQQQLAYPEKRDVFLNFNKYMELKKRQECFSCSIFPICGGLCPKQYIEGKTFCPPIKYNIQERMLLQYIFNKESN